MIIPRFAILFFLLLDTFVSSASAETQQIRNVILVIGDGMGFQQLSSALLYARYAPQSRVRDRKLHVEHMLENGGSGLMLTSVQNAIVAESASSASQMATGKPTQPEMLGLDANGNVAETFFEVAHALGKKTGLVSDTRLTHATPAAFGVHVPYRWLENEIAEKFVDGHVDVLLSGGLRHFIPVQHTPRPPFLPPFACSTKRRDNVDLLKRARERGYQLAFDRDSLARTDGREKLLGLFACSAMNDAISEQHGENDPNSTAPTLQTLTQHALRVLSNDEDGFVLMVEAGQIDWAAHQNDAGLMLHEVLRFDRILGTVLEWANGREDTLVVATADHETGSFGFSYSAYNIPQATRLPGLLFADHQPYTPDYNYLEPAVLDKLYSQRKSFFNLFKDFFNLPKPQQTPARLAQLVNANSQFTIGVTEAGRILGTMPNPYFVPKHKDLGNAIVPNIKEFSAFYPDVENAQTAMLGRALAEQQGVVWGTGTHTATPVPILVSGPSDVACQFRRLLTSVELGQLFMKLVKGGNLEGRC